ncbi:helix-turn-helix transcriptional regulator [Sinorhizobium chiapasense]|uniref:helix-turn-helix transcriptional regulator n=1 Tax=Sinorhizobium chiapasense TaxID=501572 RepID=UPI0038CD48C9
MVGLSRATIWNLRQTGSFPEPVPLVGRRVAYVLGELQDWMRSRIKDRERLKSQNRTSSPEGDQTVDHPDT